MSEFHVEVTKLKNIKKHPNADTLLMGEVNGYPVIFKAGDFSENDLVVHIPVDSIVPDTEDWAFLGGHLRIKAKKLRGIFSMGLIVRPKPEWKCGKNVQKELNITKWEPQPEVVSHKKPKTFWGKLWYRVKKALGLLAVHGENEKDPGFLPVYTDIEGWRRYKDIIQDGEEVVLTEKTHGMNSRYLYKDNRLWVGSHHMIKRYNKTSVFWRVAISLGLEEKLKKFPNIAIYGEVYGQVQDLKYGMSNSVKLVLFDAQDVTTRRYLDYDEFKKLAADLDLPTVPELYRGPWSRELLKLAEGKTTFPGADHVREGFVVKPTKERFNAVIGRVILKMVGEGYLLRKSQ